MSALSSLTGEIGIAVVDVQVHSGPIISSFDAWQTTIDSEIYVFAVSAYSEYLLSEPFEYRYSYEIAGKFIAVTGFVFAPLIEGELTLHALMLNTR